MTMFYYLVLLSTEKSSPHGCICPIFLVPDLLGQNFHPKKTEQGDIPLQAISQPSICPPCRVEAGQQHAGLRNTPPLEENPTHTYDSKNSRKMLAQNMTILSIQGTVHSTNQVGHNTILRQCNEYFSKPWGHLSFNGTKLNETFSQSFIVLVGVPSQTCLDRCHFGIQCLASKF